PVRPGASVTVQPRGNRLDLVVSGGQGGALNVENFETGRQAEEGGEEERDGRRPRARAAARGTAAPTRPREMPSQASRAESPQPSGRHDKKERGTQTDAEHAAGGAPKGATQPAEQPVAAGAGGDAPPQQEASAVARASEPEVLIAPAQAAAAEGVSVGSLLFSLPSLLGMLGLALLGAVLFVIRRRRSGEAEEDLSLPESGKDEARQEKGGRRRADAASGLTPKSIPVFDQFKGDRRKSSVTVPFERRRAGAGAEDEATRQQRLEGAQRSGDSVESRLLSPAVPSVLFGAYRIEQEVGRLVQGLSHSIEVLSSRAPDDRRAIEASLIKAMRSPDVDEDGQRRARMALEDYGFVARECASLLLSHESFERATAARTLGEMKSGHALPFLTESLYDADPVVLTEAVQSLGELGLPSAIGALLDVARRHPEIPASILEPALTACSVETIAMPWMAPAEGRAFAEGAEEFTGEIESLEPAARYEELPEWIEDESLASALERLDDEDADSRVLSAQHLAQFQVRRAVEALSALAMRDPEAAVRAAAATSLGVINHESVFVPVLVSLADESREVRAAAARALSRLSFDRADAYVRVLETAGAETLSEVAHACVKAGLASQAISRLASEDRRQAYEAFSLLSLVVKAGETQPVLDTVECHRDTEVRLACIRLLGLSYQPELGNRLMAIADNGGVPEKVRLAILEVVGSAVQQEQPVAN
ncbi:MAG TPA: HEAT repeat domain-containing protein, partial [Pyrinomonadaceae bacterium]|nr:HEAT repeat domain-containing protein [Pyrinomonadaceae bacterium]